MKRMFAAALTAVLSFSLAACGQSAAVSGSSSAPAPASTAASSAVQAAESRPTATPAPTPTLTPAPTPAPTPEPTAAPTPEPTAAPTAEPPQEAAPAENAAPAGSGHGYWTIYGDGEAFDAINALRASLGLGELAWDNDLGDVAAERCKQIMVDFSHNGMTAPEIIAMGTPDGASTVAAWQGSSPHYAQMTYEGYTRCAVAHCYDGDGCYFWCTTFG